MESSGKAIPDVSNGLGGSGCWRTPIYRSVFLAFFFRFPPITWVREQHMLFAQRFLRCPDQIYPLGPSVSEKSQMRQNI